MSKYFRYIVSRLLNSVLVLLAVAALVIGVTALSPVDPALLTFGQMSDPQAVAAKRAELKLDAPVYIRILDYINDLSPLAYIKPSHRVYLRIGDWGLKAPYLRESYQSGRPVASILASAFPQTAVLACAAILLAVLIGIPMGIWAAVRQDSWADKLMLGLASLGVALPSYVVGILLAYWLGILWQAYTGLEHIGALIEYNDAGELYYNWGHLLLPCIALGIRPVALLMQLTRSAMLDVLSQDYIRTARAKGLAEYAVIMRHALPNALPVIVTATTGWFGSLLTGAVFVEYVFDYKGMGCVMVDHLLLYDVPVVVGASMLMVLIFVLVNIAADLFYALLDKRVQLQ